MPARRRHVSVRVGAGRAVQRQSRSPRLVVAGVCPPGHPWLVDLFPQHKVKDTRFRSQGASVEHLRLPMGADLSLLPGLDARPPTRIRDAVALAFGAGVPELDLVLARARGITPWEVWYREIFELLQPFLADLRSTLVVFPDAIGPPAIGPAEPPPELRLRNVRDTIRRYRVGLAEGFQTGLVDLPVAEERPTLEVLAELALSDVSLCAWEGSAGAMRRHGWRSAAAVVGGLMASAGQPSDSLVGRQLPLPGGRIEPVSRWARLGVVEPPLRLPDSMADNCVRLAVSGPEAGTVTVESEPTLRAPLGQWSLPMMRTAKLIHHRVVIAANQFVFVECNEEQAMSLRNALDLAFRDFVNLEIVGGPRGEADPEIFTRAAPDPAQPALVAHVVAYLRPWLRELTINLAVAPGEPPRVEVA